MPFFIGPETKNIFIMEVYSHYIRMSYTHAHSIFKSFWISYFMSAVPLHPTQLQNIILEYAIKLYS